MRGSGCKVLEDEQKKEKSCPESVSYISDGCERSGAGPFRGVCGWYAYPSGGAMLITT